MSQIVVNRFGPFINMSLMTGLRAALTATETLFRPVTCQVLRAGCVKSFHTGDSLEKQKYGWIPKEPKNWLKYNDVVYPPRQLGEPRRPAEVTHSRGNIRYSHKKMWYIASMIRGMSVDEALKQLSFYKRSGAEHVKEVILEAQEMAVRDHNVEYKSNLWIEESKALRAHIVTGMMKRARGRYDILKYRHCHYIVRLREGRPPKHYYQPRKTGNAQAEEYIEELRARRPWYTL